MTKPKASPTSIVRVHTFLRENPKDWYTSIDISEVIGMTENTVKSAISVLMNGNSILSRQTSRGAKAGCKRKEYQYYTEMDISKDACMVKAAVNRARNGAIESLKW